MIFDVAKGLVRAFTEQGYELGSVEIHEHEEFCEIRNLKLSPETSTGTGVLLASRALVECGDKPIYFALEATNFDAVEFYRDLLSKGKIMLTHFVFRKVP